MTQTIRPSKPEVMSPAGYWPQLHAAIEAGADAVYFGLKHFSARAKVGFSLTELPQVMDTLHRPGVRGYITSNTLVFEHELPEAARAIAAIAQAGADAAPIVASAHRPAVFPTSCLWTVACGPWLTPGICSRLAICTLSSRFRKSSEWASRRSRLKAGTRTPITWR